METPRSRPISRAAEAERRDPACGLKHFPELPLVAPAAVPLPEPMLAGRSAQGCQSMARIAVIAPPDEAYAPLRQASDRHDRRVQFYVR